MSWLSRRDDDEVVSTRGDTVVVEGGGDDHRAAGREESMSLGEQGVPLLGLGVDTGPDDDHVVRRVTESGEHVAG